MTLRPRAFTRMWAVAVLAHLAGNWRYGDVWPDPTLIGFLLLAAGLVAAWLLIRPSRGAMLTLSALVPVTVLLEAPVLGNHWLLAGFVSLAYLLTWGSWDRFEAAARVILLVFYGFAAFAKLNSGFLDPATSCGVFYANQWLEGFGLSGISTDSALAWGAAWGSALVELAVPVLLLIRPVRAWGVLLALVFHGLISLDLGQHFYDFTAVLLPLFVLFLPDGYFERFEGVGRLLRPAIRRLLATAAVMAGVAVALANVRPLGPASAWWLLRGSFFWWIPYLVVVVGAAAGALRPVALRWKVGPVTAVLVGLVVVNGLTPYLELKTAYGWNMYSNLVTFDGHSNHLIVPSTVPVRDGNRNPVTILASSDPGLEAYAEQGYLLPWPSFRAYLAAHPDVSVTFERDGTTFEVPRAGETEFGVPVPWWWRWMPLRSIHEDEPARCQATFLPAL